VADEGQGSLDGDDALEEAENDSWDYDPLRQVVEGEEGCRRGIGSFQQILSAEMVTAFERARRLVTTFAAEQNSLSFDLWRSL